jgi:hypothetical protein
MTGSSTPFAATTYTDPFRQTLCIWAGPVSLVCYLIGMSFTGFALPMSSELRPEEIVGFYQQHRVGIRMAAICSLFCSGFMMMFAAAISAQLSRIAGRNTPWVFVQLMGGVMGNIPFALTGIIWTVAAFRPARSPEITQAINDLAWFVLEMPAPTAAIQFLAIFCVVLGDDSKDPVFPRWVAYLNILATLAFLPGVAGGLLVDYKVMDWNGAIAYALPGAASASWVLLMFVALRNAAKRAHSTPGFTTSRQAAV